MRENMVLQIRLERVARNIRSYEFAAMVGVDPQRWYKFENGRLPVPTKIADKASDILGKPANELFTPVEVEAVAV